MKNILVVDDSALMRRIFADILNGDGRFKVTGLAHDGKEALEMVSVTHYDAIVLDINMPNMNGIEFLEELKRQNRHENIVVASTDVADGAAITIQALELGAFDFIQKPKNTLDAKKGDFRTNFLELVNEAANCFGKSVDIAAQAKGNGVDSKLMSVISKNSSKSKGKKKIVAIASSTGGPNALQHVIPLLPDNLDAPVLLVQHMPQGFTKSLADRLNSLGRIKVKEAEEGEHIEKSCVYIARGGSHLHYASGDRYGTIVYSDDPPREGVRPSANYMYESLMDSDYDEIVCVVMTGMGADGTAGIKNLRTKKNVHIISQDEASCVVYGMPKAIYGTGFVNQVVTLDKIAQEIVMRVGVI